MIIRNVLGSFLLSTALSVAAYAVPGSLTYQGRIKNFEGQPLEVNGVKFEFSVTNPSGSCILYRETSTGIDMRNSGGVFDVPIGTGTKNYPIAASFKLLDSFDNSMTHNCEEGGTYSPLVDDKRLLRVQFHDGSGWKLISPDNEIRAVPFAGHAKIAQTAQKLGINTAADFILKSNIPLCGAGQYLRHIAPLGTFECTSPTVAGGNVTGNITGSSAGFTGNLTGDVTGTQSATSVDKIKGITLSMTGLAPGKVLKYNGTNWAPADESGTIGAITGLTGDVTSSGAPTATVTLSDNSVVTNKIADGTVTSTKIANGTIVDLNISSSANIADTKLATITTAGKVSGSAITSGTIGGSASINTSGIVTSASVSTSTLSTNTLQIYKTGNGNKVTITVPTSLAPDYSLQLPGNAGNSGQILSTNGSGVLSWIDAASGSLTSVTATAPLASTGGSAPVISLNDSGVTTGDYTKVTVSAKGLVTAGSSLTAADIPNLTGDVSSTLGTSNTKVEKIQGVTVVTTTPLTGQALLYGGTNWAPQYFGMGQLRSTVTGNPQIPTSCATADKTLTWSAITDTLSCTTISIANTQITGLGTASTKNFGTAAGNLVELNGAGRIPASLLPQGAAGVIMDGGNSTGATLNIGTIDASSLALKTSNSTQMTITPAGNIGIGTTTPDTKLHVVGASGAPLKIVDGNEAVGKVLTSDANGAASWQNLSNNSFFSDFLMVNKVRAATNADIVLSGLQTIDNVALNDGDRVLVKRQNNVQDNGVYLASADTWIRAPDMATWQSTIGYKVFVLEGLSNQASEYISNTAAGGVLGTTAISFGTMAVSNSIVAFGRNALGANTTGAYNTALGYASLSANTSASFNTAIGYGALNRSTTGNGANIAIGVSTMSMNTTGYYNTAVGTNSLQYNDIGHRNTAVGYLASRNATSGNYNTALGYSALRFNLVGSNNTAIGPSALENTKGNSNIGIGPNAGFSLQTGDYNIIIGGNSGSSIDGLSNQIIIADGQGNSRIRVDHLGNVGIGTSAPGSPLTVNGIIESKSGGIKFPDGTVQISATSSNVKCAATISSGTRYVNCVNLLTGRVVQSGGGGAWAVWQNANQAAWLAFATGGPYEVAMTYDVGSSYNYIVVTRLSDGASISSNGSSTSNWANWISGGVWPP